MPSVLLRKPEAQLELEDIQRRYLDAERRLSAMKATRAVPWHEIELAETELDALWKRIEKLRKGAAA